MLFDAAQQLIQRQLMAMNKAYGATLFDEYAILRIKAEGQPNFLPTKAPATTTSARCGRTT